MKEFLKYLWPPYWFKKNEATATPLLPPIQSFEDLQRNVLDYNRNVAQVELKSPRRKTFLSYFSFIGTKPNIYSSLAVLLRKGDVGFLSKKEWTVTEAAIFAIVFVVLGVICAGISAIYVLASIGEANATYLGRAAAWLAIQSLGALGLFLLDNSRHKKTAAALIADRTKNHTHAVSNYLRAAINAHKESHLGRESRIGRLHTKIGARTEQLVNLRAWFEVNLAADVSRAQKLIKNIDDGLAKINLEKQTLDTYVAALERFYAVCYAKIPFVEKAVEVKMKIDELTAINRDIEHLGSEIYDAVGEAAQDIVCSFRGMHDALEGVTIRTLALPDPQMLDEEEMRASMREVVSDEQEFVEAISSLQNLIAPSVVEAA